MRLQCSLVNHFVSSYRNISFPLDQNRSPSLKRVVQFSLMRGRVIVP
ncbi:hypothetical protein A359_08270 [secondary endosymbiont of Ctenarytaina eucalypti]|uniref:Uncharacterized protein n=1 Tax=secondary endosymbiont of Ctenarytaina eucalypti TaxID=1199245 RepID=J3YSG4_9ENTR|nr:hypothetical protein A359_08270 [secondary endosymbiont of Ctenarytaina eucalypti]